MRAKLQLVALSMVALCLLGVGMSGCVSTTPATSTQFTTGTAPPQAVSDLLRHGTAVLLINQRNCPNCDEENPKFADLQAQYKDTNVSFATFNINDNGTSLRVAHAYNVTITPTILVVREDGAFAKLVCPLYPDNALIDLNAVKSAIDDAQKWQSLNPTATVATPPDYSSHYTTGFSTYNVIVTPFSLTTSARGNDLYVGVVRNFSQQSAHNTITLEHCTSEAQAAQIYQTTVTDATNAGYVARATAPDGFPAPPVQAWQGDYGLSFKSVAYYQDPSVGNAWVVETQYV
jgi:thiol-disulfide isomerase/thioredoxin